MTPSWDSLKAIFTLADVTARQQAETEALLIRLHKVSGVYEQTLESLPGYVERGVNRALPEAAETAAKRIATHWTDANTHADNASAAYDKAKRAAPWLIFGSVVVAC